MILKVNKVSKGFINEKKEKFLANNNISFEVKEGEVLGILGPNGAGKTTLLRMLAGIMTPNEGKITYDNLSFPKDSKKIKKEIAFLSGNTKLYKDISPYEFLKLCGEYYGIDKKDLNTKIENAIKLFSLEEFKDKRIEYLSTGQLQRTSIARCVIHNPQVYIFDEVTSGLDIIASKVILDFIKKEKQNNKSIIYSTHYMEEAENICDRVILIHKGKIIKSGTPLDIKEETNTTNLRDAFFKLIEGDKNE